mmetsp:Transcript_15807/g.34212  ORF Transcript_15807/g.34212 Transcript_15807/m.34212 type:complete len:93 (-) Transcript_15807:535-813(-)
MSRAEPIPSDKLDAGAKGCLENCATIGSSMPSLCLQALVVITVRITTKSTKVTRNWIVDYCFRSFGRNQSIIAICSYTRPKKGINSGGRCNA